MHAQQQQQQQQQPHPQPQPQQQPQPQLRVQPQTLPESQQILLPTVPLTQPQPHLKSQKQHPQKQFQPKTQLQPPPLQRQQQPQKQLRQSNQSQQSQLSEKDVHPLQEELGAVIEKIQTYEKELATAPTLVRGLIEAELASLRKEQTCISALIKACAVIFCPSVSDMEEMIQLALAAQKTNFDEDIAGRVRTGIDQELRRGYVINLRSLD
ncbi:hypothetical protein BJ741DRAFT_684418 [Chytriomyces cf. hyalinus JEL632]|nr:hypothetical protein BJ741DRAFT_684418 [Chytriomyces cf. hyalinus JEL632]